MTARVWPISHQRSRNDWRGKVTRRQSQVAELIGQGKTNKEIARELGLSPETVKDYIRTILLTCNMKNRAQVALLGKQDPGFANAIVAGVLMGAIC
jgi:DNA-binding NarL/FixJ family response regulator